jgi:hypothetical protein
MSNPNDPKTLELTKVDPEIFKKMIDNKGYSVADYNQLGFRVLLFFTSSLGSIYCQGTMNDILELDSEFTKMNIIPMVIHTESNSKFEEMISSSETTQKFATLLHMERQDFMKDFNFNPNNLIEELRNIDEKVPEVQRLKNAGLKILTNLFPEIASMPGCFLIYKQKVIAQYKKDKLHQRFDLGRLVLDTDGFWERYNFSVFDSLKKNQTPMKKKKLSFQHIVSPRYFKKKGSLDFIPTGKQEKEIKLQDVFNEPHYFRFFKLFSTDEYCVENILFYEEVQRYKRLDEIERPKYANQIFDAFFTEDSVHEINCSREIKLKLKENFEKYEKELFDDAVKDMFFSVFCSLTNYSRMRQMLLYKHLKSIIFPLISTFVGLLQFISFPILNCPQSFLPQVCKHLHFLKFKMLNDLLNIMIECSPFFVSYFITF